MIEFICAPEDHGVIAKPVPASEVLPDWFRKLPPVNREHLQTQDSGQTVKRCMPFLDVMGIGWIIPLAVNVRLEVTDDGEVLNSGWDFDKAMVSNHSAYQLAGHPRQPRPTCKFHNYWTIKTPPGWSCLFLPPINRPNTLFEVYSGIVDTDGYHTYVNFPFVSLAPEGAYSLAKGTPMVQVIPFRRDGIATEALIRAETKEDQALRLKIDRNIISGPGWYRDEVRAKVRQSKLE